MILVDSEYNEASGITTEYWMHPGGNRVTIRAVQDVEPVFKGNRAELNSHSSKSPAVFRRPGLGTKVAAIPCGVVEEVLQKKGLNLMNCSDKDLRRFLNDVDHSKMRTARGYL